MLGIIGGTLLPNITELSDYREQTGSTPYGKPSAPIVSGIWQDQPVAFLARHGQNHQIAPHKINYRANIWALKELGANQIIACASVGGISKNMAPGCFVIPDQLIDYTYGRENSFFTENFSLDCHIDFTYPYSAAQAELLADAMQTIGLNVATTATHAIVQGPRLETAAEIQRLKQDGCDIVGMTGMPEAILARELNIDYVCCALVVNWAAGIMTDTLDLDQIRQQVHQGQKHLLNLLKAYTQLIRAAA